MKPRKIEYGYDEETRSIVLPEGAPFDGKPVLIRTNTGWVEAWWDAGRTVQRHEGPEYEGFCWICYDDKFDVDLDEALEWMPLPRAEASTSFSFIRFLDFLHEQLDKIPRDKRKDAQVTLEFEDSIRTLEDYETKVTVRW
jgi:hypothetical protein